MSAEYRLGSHTEELLAERDVQAIVVGTINGLMELYGEKIVTFQTLDNTASVDTLALVGPPKRNFAGNNRGNARLGYHYAYTATSDSGVRAGIVVANAVAFNPLLSKMNRDDTMRHYATNLMLSPQASVHRTDWTHVTLGMPEKSVETELTMESILKTPLGMGDPTTDFVTEAFRAEVLELGISTPVRPLTNLFPTFIDY